jgi:hypothetical protein
LLCFCCVAGLWDCAPVLESSLMLIANRLRSWDSAATQRAANNAHLSLHPRQRLHYAAHIYTAAERDALIILWIMKENNKFCISPFVNEPMLWVWRAIQSLLHIIYIGTLCIAPRTNFYVIPYSDAAIKVSFYVAADLWRPGWWRTGNILRHCIRPLMYRFPRLPSTFLTMLLVTISVLYVSSMFQVIYYKNN